MLAPRLLESEGRPAGSGQWAIAEARSFLHLHISGVVVVICWPLLYRQEAIAIAILQCGISQATAIWPVLGLQETQRHPAAVHRLVSRQPAGGTAAAASRSGPKQQQEAREAEKGQQATSGAVCKKYTHTV